MKFSLLNIAIAIIKCSVSGSIGSTPPFLLLFGGLRGHSEEVILKCN
jgi:hypothetical protein